MATKLRSVRPSCGQQRQRGSVLIVSLVMLLLMTMVAIASMQGTVLEDRMTGNMHNRDIAFQAAEAALRAGEAYLLATSPPPSFTNANGLYIVNDANRPNWTGSTLSDGKGAFTYSGDLGTIVSKKPEYYIEKIASVQPAGTTIEAGTAVPVAAYYRVTALGYGGTSDTVVVLSSIYRTH